MEIFPTKDDFEQIYREKGHDAIVWLAWRSCIRALPIFGSRPLEELFPEDEVENTYLVFLCYYWLHQYFFEEKKDKYGREDREKRMPPSYIFSTDDPLCEGVFYGAMTAFDDVHLIDYFEMSLDEISLSQVGNSFGRAWKFRTLGSHKYQKLSRECLDSDINIIKASKMSLDIPFWNTNPVDFTDCEPPIYKTLREEFLSNIGFLGLHFIVDDFRKIISKETLHEHVANYFQPVSKADLNNPEALRHIIFGGEAGKIHAVRTLLLGSGGAGKSSLADRLQGVAFDGKPKPATQSIEYQNHLPLDLQKAFPKSNPRGIDLSLYLWDFGGQTIFHGLHRTFLHENCVYILVVDSRHEQAPDEWLHQIRHLAGGSATVFLVTNQHDGCDIRQNETRLLREFSDLLDNNSFHYFSCIDSKSSELTTFVNELTKAALDSQKAVWKETLNIHQAIREYTKQRSVVFISMTQIKKIISDNGRVEDSKAMINSLEQLGFLASITKGKLSYCLKPEWAVDRAYELLYSDTLRDKKGKLDLLDFDECFAAAPTEEQQSKLLEFLDHRSLCFELPESGEYFFPDAATADEPETIADLLKQKQRLQIRFDLPYLPLGFHTRLIKPLFNQEAGIKDSQNIWRQGFITQRAESYAVVQYLLRKSSIEVTLVGNPEHYATLLDKFYTALSSAVAESKTRLQSFAIRPFVFLEKGLFELDRTKESQAFSVHSVVELVKVLQAANGDLKKVYEDVRDMAADKKGDTHYHTNINGDGQTAVGSDNATMNQYIDKSYTEITADQRHQIATIVGELLKDAGNLPTEQLIAVTETKKALEAPVDDAVSQNLLGKVVSSIDGVATFTKDKALPIAEFAIKHKEVLGGALAAAKAACNL